MNNIYELHPKWVSKKEMAKRLGVSPRTVYAMWKRGELLRKKEHGQILWALITNDEDRGSQVGSSEDTSSILIHASEEASEGRGKEKSEEAESNLLELLMQEKQRNEQLIERLIETECQLAMVKVERDQYRSQANKRRWNVLSVLKRWMQRFLGQ